MRAARIFAVAFIIAIPTLAISDELRIASWNIANLASEPGKSLRGFVRTDKDYSDTANQIRQLRPDIIALQEIGSIPGARRALGNGYRVEFESRCLNNAHKCNADDGDIYTAIAFRNELADRVTVFQVDSLAVIHTDECGNKRPVRGGVGVKLDIGGRPTWVVSVHMKAACRTNNSRRNTPLHCNTQRNQYNALLAWIQSRPDGEAVIVAGDLNRELLSQNDRRRNQILGSISRPVRIVPDSGRVCWENYRFNWNSLKEEARRNNPIFNAQGLDPWIYSPKSYRDIDFFVMVNMVNSTPRLQFSAEQREPNGLHFAKPREILKKCDGTIVTRNKKQAITFGQATPSDHCPILLKVNDK